MTDREEVVELYRRLPVTDDVEWWVDRATESPDARVLYIGCGTGRLALPIAEACKELVAVDVDAAMLAAFEARLRTVPDLIERVRLVRARSQDLSLDERFGLVVLPSNLLNGIIDPGERADVIRGAAQHCLPGGRVILQVLNPFWMGGPATEGRGTIAPHDGGHAIAVSIHDVSFDPWLQRQRARITYRFDDGAVLHDDIDAVALYPRELRALAYRAGLDIIERWGAVPGADALGVDGGTWHLVCAPLGG